MWATLPSMPTARQAPAGATAPCPTGVSVLKGTCVYAIGGFANGGFLSTVEAYSPVTGMWATLPSMPTARQAPAGATAPCPTGVGGLAGTCVYAIGGFNSSGDLSTVEAYSPVTGMWAALRSMPTARDGLAGATAPCPGALNRTCVYAIGGENLSGFLSTVEAYSPVTGMWAAPRSMPTARAGLAGATAPCPTGVGGPGGTCVYAIGGFNSSGDLSTVEAYTPAADTWAALPSMSTARERLAGATAPCPGALNRTCVYAIGGSNGSGELSTVEAFAVGR
jgi:hypothetical protein